MKALRTINSSFDTGQRVRLKHDPGRIGVITGKTQKYGAVRIGEITPPDKIQDAPLIQRLIEFKPTTDATR